MLESQGVRPKLRCGSVLPAAFAVAVVCAVYVGTLSTLHPSVFWSPDEGAKFIQMHSLLVEPNAPHRLSYGAADSDPFFTFYPSAPIYPKPLWPAGVRNHWPALFPVLSLPLFRIAGLWGLYCLPVAGGVLAAFLAGTLARRLSPGAAAPAIVFSGLASPLYFHSALFLEHSLACALAIGSLLCGWSLFSNSTRSLLICCPATVCCLAGFYALRDEALIFFAALVGSGVLTLTAGRTRRIALAGIVLLSILLLASSQWIMAFPGSGRDAALLCDAANALARLKDSALWNALPQHVLHVLINNPAQSGVPLPPVCAMAGLCGLFLCALSPIVIPPRRFSCWLVGVCLVVASAACGLCMPERYRAIHGLLLPMPGAVLAWLPSPHGHNRQQRGERFLTTLFLLLPILHLVATWLLRRPAGGPEWGLRYVMVVYLLAAVLGCTAVVRFLETSKNWQRFAGLGAAAMLLGLSCGYNVRGIFEQQVTKRDLRAFEQEIRNAGIAVVTDQWWLAAALAPTFVQAELYTLNPGTDLPLWVDLVGSRAPAFVYVSYTPPPNVVRTERGLLATLRHQRIIQQMTFSHFEIQTAP